MAAIDTLYQSIVADVVAEVERRVLEQLQTVAVSDRRLDAQEAADYLKISRKTLYTMCKEKQIAHIPVGAKGSQKPNLIFRQSTLDAWLRQREEESTQKAR